jgi:hypothetical protein
MNTESIIFMSSYILAIGLAVILAIHSFIVMFFSNSHSQSVNNTYKPYRGSMNELRNILFSN